jgi:long-chain fatty acid transport protein
MRKTQLLIALAAIGFAGSAFATNVMNLEGYGPIATGMGGASIAYDNGTAGVMGNPATIGLGAEGSRLDVAVGFLGPDIDVSNPGGSFASDGDGYIMPAIGWTKKSGQITYGVAMFAQGGMGTEYPAGRMGPGTPEMRSEVSVGRLIFPIAYNISTNLTVGGSIDYVWAGMDLMMAQPGASIIFSDRSDYTGKAKGTGWAGKLGLVYKANDKVNVGATYHSQTSLSDLGGNGTFNGAPGTYKIIDFQWPETYGVGMAIQATPNLMIAADIKHSKWSEVMKDFKFSFNGGAFPAMLQNWDDQTVYQIGLSYKVNDPLTLRVGYNYGKNPIPDSTLNFLFPAIVESHYTLGLGYALSKASDLNFSLTFAPEVEQTNPNMFGAGVPGTITHSQTNWQLMYSKRF